METKLPKSNQVAFKWSIIYVVVAIILTYTFQFLNIDQNSPAKYLSYIPFIAFMLLAQKEFKDQNGGYITFSEGFGTGFKYAVISGIIMGIFIYIYLSFLSPQIFDQALDTQREAMAQKGMTAEQIDTGMSIAKKFGPAIGAVVLIIGSAVIGALLALIGAAIFKNERPPFDINDETTYIDPAV